MQKAITGDFSKFDASDWKIGIVWSQFNTEITSQLYNAAIQEAKAYKIKSENIEVIKVAGSMEIPLALQHLARSGKYKVLLAIGCIIRGDTPHFDYVCKVASEGILRVQLDYSIPIGFGVLTCDNLQQAEDRSSLGGEHLRAALQLAKAIENKH